MAGKGGKGQLAVKTTAANKDKKGPISESSRPEDSFLWVGSSAPENEDLCEWPCWGNCCCLFGFNSGVPDCRGARAGWKCKQRFEGEENDTQAFEAAIRGEEELDTLIRETIDGGGVVPHTHMSLISKKNL